MSNGKLCSSAITTTSIQAFSCALGKAYVEMVHREERLLDAQIEAFALGTRGREPADALPLALCLTCKRSQG